MGSHYIPVGKLKIDKSILDLACPAAGYDETPPNPAIYCPANGYENPFDPGVDLNIPEVPEPTSGDGEIILIISKVMFTGNIATIRRTSGNLLWELYGEGDVLLDSGAFTHATNAFSYDISGLTGGYSETYFKFIFRPIENESINYLSLINTSTVAIYVNAPNITTMTFNGISFLQKLWFCDNMDSWAGGTLIFANLKRITELTLPKSMNSVTTMNSWFYNSIIPEIVLPESMPALANLYQAFYNTETRAVTLPKYIVNDGTTIIDVRYMFTATRFLKTIHIRFQTINPLHATGIIYDMPDLENYIQDNNIYLLTATYIFNNCLKLKNEELKFYVPNDNTLSASPILQNNTSVKKIIIDSTKVIGATFPGITIAAGGCAVEEIWLPDEYEVTGTSFNSTTTFGTGVILPMLKKIKGLKKLTTPNLINKKIIGCLFLNSNYPKLEEIETIEETDLLWSTPLGIINTKIKIFDQPNFIFYTNLNINATLSSPGNVEYFDVNFEQSFIEGCSTSLNFRYQQLDAVELERISGRLPAISGTLDCRNNPGYSTFDKSIAEAKGWTVL